jgi:putative hydrolase of the HAD superfamily
VKPEAIFFDLDGTLVYLDDAVREEKMARICAALAKAHPGIEAARLYSEFRRLTPEIWSKGDVGLLDGISVMHEIWRQALALCGCDDEDVVLSAHDLFWRDRQGIIRLFDDIHTPLRRLQGALPMAVLTNGPRDTQLDKLAVNDCDHYFSIFAASSEVGATKPDPALFRFVLERLGMRPERVWHVGDSLQSDVAGARAAGITAVWLNRSGIPRGEKDPRPDHEIGSLAELLPLIERAP